MNTGLGFREAIREDSDQRDQHCAEPPAGLNENSRAVTENRLDRRDLRVDCDYDQFWNSYT